MASETKFNVYHSLSIDGPWALANNTPVSFDASGHHSYSITGLKEDTQYYVVVIGGIVVDGEFLPLFYQPVGTQSQGLYVIEGVRLPNVMMAQTFSAV